MAVKTTLEWVDPNKLRDHPLNAQIYGSGLCQEFVARVKNAGRIIQPIAIVGRGAEYPELTVISGHRRKEAAKELKFGRVPVVVEHDAKTKEDIDELTILSNDQRDRTTDQKRKEADVLLDIERRRADKRMKSGKKTDGDTLGNFFPGSDVRAPKALEIVADKVGLSAPTLAKALEVGERIDQLEDRGHSRKAEELRGRLNENVSAAHREVARPKPRTNGRVIGQDNGKVIHQMKSLMAQVVRCLDSRGKNGNHAKCNHFLNQFLEAWDKWT